MSARLARVLLLPLVAAHTWFVWTRYLPQGLEHAGARLRELAALPFPPETKPWMLDAAGAIGLGFIAMCIGGRVLDWLAPRLGGGIGGVERLLLAPALGFTVLVLGASALGFARLFRPAALHVLAAVFLLAAAGRIRSEGARLWRTLRSTAASVRAEPLSAALLLASAAFLFFAGVVTAAPDTAPDVLQFHLPYVRQALDHGWFFYADPYRTNIPLYAHVLYGLGESLRGTALSRFLNFLMLPGLAMGVALLTRRLSPSPANRVAAPALAVLFLVSTPTLLFHATCLYPDLAVAFFDFLALYAAIRYLETRATAWVALAGVFAGMAAGTKAAGLYAVPVVAVVLAAGSLRRGREAARAVVVFLLLALAIASPWYLRNWVNTGDPLFPALTPRLATPSIDPREAREILRDAQNRQRISTSAVNPVNFLWLITMEGERLVGSIGPVFLWTLPLVVFATLSIVAIRPDAAWLSVALSSVLFSVLWLFGPQWLRYYLPAVAILSPLASRAVFDAGGVRLRRVWIWPAVAFTLLNLPPFSQSWASGHRQVITQIPYAYTFGSETAEQFLRRHVPGYSAVEFLNEQRLPMGTRALALYGAGLPRAYARFDILDIFDIQRIFCRDSAGTALRCYRLTSADLLGNLDRHGVGIVAFCRRPEDLEERPGLTLSDNRLRLGLEFLDYAGGCFFYRRTAGRPPQPEKGQRYVAVDLLARFAAGERVSMGRPSRAAVRLQQPDRYEPRLSLVMFPPNEAVFRVDLPPGASLSFAAGMERRAARYATGTVLEIAEGKSPDDLRVVFSRLFDARIAGAGWAPVSLPLSGAAGGETLLRIRTIPAGNTLENEDWLAIAEPVIYGVETGEGVADAEPFSPRFESRPPLRVQFLPAAVRPGEHYTIHVAELAGGRIDVLAAYAGEPLDEVRDFCVLDKQGSAQILVPPMRPGIIQVSGIRRSGERIWRPAAGQIEVKSPTAAR